MPAKCPSYEALAKCGKMKKKACKGKAGKGMCTVCGKACLPGKNPFVCKYKKKSKFYAHCEVTSSPTKAPTVFRIHVWDLENKKHTYPCSPDDLIGVIRQKAADDAGMDGTT